jgi:hypothetical protein
MQANTIMLSAVFSRMTEDATSTMDQHEQEARVLSISVPHKELTDACSQATKEKLVHFMKLLHHVFIFPDPTNGGMPVVEMDSTNNLEEFALLDDSVFTESVTGFVTGVSEGEFLPEGRDSNPCKKSSCCAFWVACEMIRRGQNLSPGILQDAIQRHLSHWQTPTAVKDMLCEFRIASSRSRTRLQDIQAVRKKTLEGWDLKGKKRWVLFISHDNLGFRILGARAGCAQHVMIVVQFISPEQLQEQGVCRPTGSPLPPASRIRKEWADERDLIEKQAILPTHADHTILGEQILGQIDALLKIEHLIPSLVNAREFLASGEKFVADTRLSTSYGTQLRTKHLEGVTEVEVEENEDGDRVDDETMTFDPCLNATMHDREDQQIGIDLPMKADLNKKETVQGLTTGALDTRERVLGSSGTVDTNKKPVMDDCGITTGGDGAPSHTFLCLEAADPEAHRNINNQSGGFHNLLNCKQRVGCRFGDSHLRDCLHPFRDADPKKDWFLHPGDPGQTLLEEPEMSAAHHVIAMRNLSRIRQGESMNAADVHNFMLERAQESDHCMVVLMWLHHVEASNVIRDSEPENNPDLCRAGARLALLLRAKTHAIKHVRMGVQHWVWWHCSSDADKMPHDKFCWTKKKTNGRTIWFDRFVEWFNKDVRECLGEHAKPNQELLLQSPEDSLVDQGKEAG